MKRNITEVSLDQLVDLARNAGMSANAELPDKIKGMMAGRRASDHSSLDSSDNPVKRVLAGLRF